MLRRISDVDIRLLRVFKAVVEAGGFAPACGQLNISESTVSTHMSDLETRIGFRLCDRGRGGFRLTENGEHVYQYSNDLLEFLDNYCDKITSLSKRLHGALSLTFSDALSHHPDFKLAQALEAFQRRNIEVHISLDISSPREAEKKILEGEVDIAISPVHQKIPGISFQNILKEVNNLYCGVAHPLFHAKSADEEDALLKEASFISRGYMSNFHRGILNYAQFDATVYDVEAAKILIESSQYVGFLPDYYAKRLVDEGRMKAIQPESINLPIKFGVLVARGRTLTNVASLFLQELFSAHGLANKSL